MLAYAMPELPVADAAVALDVHIATVHRRIARGELVARKDGRGRYLVTVPDDVHTQGVQEFNRLVYASKKLYPVLIPLRDGVTVCQKL